MESSTKDKIIEILSPKLNELGLSMSDLSLDESLLHQGILDSISFLEFTIELESVFNLELDFSELDPSDFTSINNLIKLLDNGN